MYIFVYSWAVYSDGVYTREWRTHEQSEWLAADGTVLPDSIYPPEDAVWLRSLEIIYPVAGIVVCQLPNGVGADQFDEEDIPLGLLQIREEDIYRVPPAETQ